MLNSIKLGETIISWEKTLISEEISNLKLIKDDNELNKTVFDLQFQRVINNDCERTRVKERPLVKNFERDLELFITFYCKKYDIKYKQGMNEIIGPFILIKSLANISSHRIFNLFSVFIYKFLTNYYHEEEFFSLKSSLGILKLLIKYHEPAISNSFDHGVITPEMYATSWILTIFANKTKIDILLLLWNIVIVENDELFVHFLVVGFLMKNKDVIIKCDYSQIPILISTLSITSKEDVISIYNNAIKIRDTTPHSFRIFARNLYIFSRADINHLKLYFEYYRPDKLFTLPILPSELIYITYNSTIECPDENCEKYQRKYEKLIHSKEFEIAYPTKTSFFPCYFCKRKKGSKQENSSSISPKSFVFLDFRLEENCICGYLPGTLILDKKDFEDPNFGEKLTERFSYEKGKYHFVMITSETENFFKYEEKFYQENKEETHKKEFIPTKVSRIICEKEINKIKGSVEIENKLKEYDTFKKIIKIFTRKNFPYISFILGGFKDIHNAKVPLLSHDIKLCYLCKKINKKNERRKYSFSKRDSLIKENNDNRKSMILTSKTINQFSISRQTSISPLFLDPHSNNYTLIKTNYSIDDVAEILNNSKIRVFECLLLDYKNLVVNCNNSSKQVLIFLCREDVKILKLEEDIFDENKYSLIEKIFPKNVLFVKRKKDQKNAVELSFISYLHEKMSIFLELSNDIESKYFISLLREYFDSIKSI